MGLVIKGIFSETTNVCVVLDSAMNINPLTPSQKEPLKCPPILPLFFNLEFC